ncbi:MAG: hypothetical protein RLZZ245_3840 [Verrucomicrobiota bacterium]|jgi:hypothetical protein
MNVDSNTMAATAILRDFAAGRLTEGDARTALLKLSGDPPDVEELLFTAAGGGDVLEIPAPESC